MSCISWLKKTPAPTTGAISGGQTQAEIDESMHHIVIPDSVQADCINIAHEDHQGASMTLGYLKESCWFPNMKKLADEYVETCIPCLASIPNTCAEPLKPNVLPDRPWQKLHPAFKEPIRFKYYLHLLID